MEISNDKSIASRVKVDEKRQQNGTQDSASEQQQAEEQEDERKGRMTSKNS